MGDVQSGGMGFDTRIDTFMGEICAILKIRCQDQDQAQKDPERILHQNITCIVKKKHHAETEMITYQNIMVLRKIVK